MFFHSLLCYKSQWGVRLRFCFSYYFIIYLSCVQLLHDKGELVVCHFGIKTRVGVFSKFNFVLYLIQLISLTAENCNLLWNVADQITYHVWIQVTYHISYPNSYLKHIIHSYIIFYGYLWLPFIWWRYLSMYTCET